MPPPPFKPDATLHRYDLHILYYGMAMAALDAAGTVSLVAATESIPGEVYTTCVRANWIEHPNPAWDVNEDAVQLGEYLVPRSFKAAWLENLEESIAEISGISERQSQAEAWEHPTPPEILKRFRIASKLTNERIAEGTGVSLKTLERLITRDRLGMRMGNATKLLSFMKGWMQLHAKTSAVPSSEVTYFTNLTEVELYWRRKK